MFAVGILRDIGLTSCRTVEPCNTVGRAAQHNAMLGWQGTVQRWLQQDTADTSEAQLMSALQTARRALIEEQANSKAQARAQAEEVDALRLQLDLVRQELQAACERVRLLSESERDKGSTAREMQLHHAVVRWTEAKEAERAPALLRLMGTVR